MLYHLAANSVLVIHGLFIVFVVLGGLLALWKPWWPWLHLPVALYGITIEWVGWVCPLTPLENRLRMAAGEQGYAGGFIEHYLLPLIYPADYTPGLRLVLGLAVVLVNAGVYSYVVYRHRVSRMDSNGHD